MHLGFLAKAKTIWIMKELQKETTYRDFTFLTYHCNCFLTEFLSQGSECLLTGYVMTVFKGNAG